MLARFRYAREKYPHQFWLMFFGMLISTIGSSMIWPFLMIYVSQRLKLPLTEAASLMTINATCGLICSFIAGPIVDRVGRKWVMVISLVSNGIAYLVMSQATTLPAFMVLMAVQGAVNPLYRVGSDAMMADLIPSEERVEAYSLLRMSNNLGIALGPAIGGFVASSSYTIAFICAAVGLTTYGLLLAFLAHETLPTGVVVKQPGEVIVQKERLGGYDRVLRDTGFISFTVAFIFTQICASLIWVLLSVYSKVNYNLSESQYGFIPATNAIMVVLFQLWVTQVTRKYRPLPVMAVGTLFYASGCVIVALSGGFWGFWLAMVVMTIGELILIPTSSTYTANRAPADMRGRYMSIYGLTWSMASGIGPVFGGFLSDRIGPKAIWYGGGLVGSVGVLIYLFLFKRSRAVGAQQPSTN